MKKVISSLGLAIMMFALALPTASAAEFITGDREGGNVSLPAGETHRNVYTAGGTVFVNSNILGDIYAAGGTITLESNIEQDAVVAGGTVTINGDVGGDVRVGGGTVTINSRVAGDVIVGGGTVVLTENASVGGDLAIGGGTVNVEAPVAGSAKVGGGTVTLNSAINGEVDVRADQSLVIGSRAVIPQAISYQGRNEASVRDGAQIGTIDFQRIEGRDGNEVSKALAAIFTVAFILKMLALILAGLLLMKLFPRTSRESVDYMQRGFWMNLLIGFLTLVVGPIVVIILLVTFLGLYIGILTFLVWLVLLLLAALVAAVFVGAWVLKQLTNRTDMRYDWQALVVGIIVLAVVMLIPIIGNLIFMVLLLIAYGGLIRQLYDRMRSEQQTINQ